MDCMYFAFPFLHLGEVSCLMRDKKMGNDDTLLIIVSC